MASVSAQHAALRSAPVCAGRRSGAGVARGTASVIKSCGPRVGRWGKISYRRDNVAIATRAATSAVSDAYEVPRGDTAGAMMSLSDVQVTVGDRDLLVGANLRVVGGGEKMQSCKV